jgi:hypothetical protein
MRQVLGPDAALIAELGPDAALIAKRGPDAALIVDACIMHARPDAELRMHASCMHDQGRRGIHGKRPAAYLRDRGATATAALP